MSLVTLSDVKDYLGESTATYDTFLQMQIDLFSSAVEGYCNRKFLAADYTQTYYRSDYTERERSCSFELYHFPLNSIASVTEIETVNGIDYPTVLDASEYRSGETGRLVKLSCGLVIPWFNNIRSNSRIEVVYNSGYATTPEVVKHTIYRLIESEYNKKKTGVAQNFGSNVQRVSIPSVISIDFDYSLQANERSSKFGMIIGDYANTLDYYRSMRILTGNLEEKYVS